jgi:hypothetical protein
MAEHIWSVLCAKSLQDPDSKVITLLDVVESLSEDDLEQRIEEALREGKKGVLINARMQLVSWWFRADVKEEVLQVRFTLRDQAGNDIFTRNANAKWEDANTTLRLFFKLENLPVSVLGMYWFVVEHLKAFEGEEPQWIPVTRVPLGIANS